MSRATHPALLIAGAVGALAIACSSFGSSEVAATSEAGAPEAGGAEGGGGGPCELSASPALVAATTSAPSRLQTNGEHYFWIEGGTRIVRASIADCTTTEVARGNITALAVDAKWIVWGEPGYHAVARGDVGMPPRTAATPVSPELILAGGTAFWLDTVAVAACDTPCEATSTAAVVDAPSLLAANGLRFFVFAKDTASGATSNLLWHPLKLDGVTTLMGPIATGQDPIALAANAERVFWVSSNGQVSGAPSGGGSPIVLPKVVGARTLAADAAFVYVATATTIARAPVAGGDVVPVVTGENDIRSLLVTDDAIVWATTNAIRRVQK